MATSDRRAAAAGRATPRPELHAEFASRLRDPFEVAYMGVLRSNDPLLLERGNGCVELYRDLRRDGKVFGGLQKRQLALIGRPWQVEPRVRDNAKASADALAVMEILKGFAFDRMCAELLEALLAGFAVMEVIWTVRDGWVVPQRVVKRAQRRFVFVQDDASSPPALHLLVRENMLRGVRTPERKFIVHRCNPEDDNPYGTGLGLQLFWPVFFKRKGIVAWNKLNDRFGSPTPHGKYPGNAGPQVKATLESALRAMSSDGYIATPVGMDISLLESKLSGNVTTQQQLCEYMDGWIAEVLLGQEPASTGGGGALAAASKERQSVRLDLTQADSDLLSETLNETLIQWICELNGFEPCHVYRQIKSEEDLKAQAETDKTIFDMGFELDEDAVRAKYGEGWRKRVAPAPLPPTAAVSGPASFAEPAAMADPVQVMTDTAMQASAPALAGLVENIEAVVSRSQTLAEAQQLLVQAYGDLDAEALQKIMTAAFALATLKGMADVLDEASERA